MRKKTKTLTKIICEKEWNIWVRLWNIKTEASNILFLFSSFRSFLLISASRHRGFSRASITSQFPSPFFIRNRRQKLHSSLISSASSLISSLLRLFLILLALHGIDIQFDANTAFLIICKSSFLLSFATIVQRWQQRKLSLQWRQLLLRHSCSGVLAGSQTRR